MTTYTLQETAIDLTDDHAAALYGEVMLMHGRPVALKVVAEIRELAADGVFSDPSEFSQVARDLARRVSD